MTREQGVVLSLLDEIDEICDETGIKYYLIEHQLHNALLQKGISGYSADVAMSWKDFSVFRAYIQNYKKGAREFEGLENNRKMPGLFYRYVDSRTLLLDLDYAQAYTKFGIAVNIHIIQKESKLFRALSFADRCIRIGGSRNVLDSKKKKAVYAGIKALQKIMPHVWQKGLHKLFEKNCWTGENGQKPTILADILWGAVLPGNFNQGIQKIWLSGHLYHTVKSPEAYMERRYGAGWRTKKLSPPAESYMVSTNPYVPYKEFMEQAYIKKMNRKFYKDRRRFLRVFKNEFKEYDAKEKEGWKYLFAAEARIQCWKKYMPVKEELLRKWEEGKQDEVMLELEDYRVAVGEYKNSAMVPCFDPDIWYMYMTWLQENRWDALAVELERKVWKEHLQPIRTEETNRWLDSKKEDFCTES
ncbi:hypothetical protein H8S37_12880 [Mediterraneibacter sp. NSJ-55]|uniref:Uncharacterized protein n=1 Tax=Mediterraneibacter hominis TaxID=2763054 RepID=A0A923LKV6_9FIRM|nr:hypothetical protein [Mediterraneibacter hominis]MBC5689811.1 hypothetical protein [Mediterraneibacter hominis]